MVHFGLIFTPFSDLKKIFFAIKNSFDSEKLANFDSELEKIGIKEISFIVDEKSVENVPRTIHPGGHWIDLRLSEFFLSCLSENLSFDELANVEDDLEIFAFKFAYFIKKIKNEQNNDFWDHEFSKKIIYNENIFKV